MALRDDIKEKALVCIDEVYTTSEAGNASFFPVDRVLDEAARWVVHAVPLKALGPGTDLSVQSLEAREDGTGSLLLPEDFIRLLRFRMKGWCRPVIIPIRDTDERYAQQFNPVLRGGDCKPVVALCEDDRRLEYFSSSKGAGATAEEARYFGITEVDDAYPERLADITAWKTAELVMAVMNDIAAMQICAGKVAEILQLL